MPGMITSDEPGIYREGMHGIRHENMVLCVEAGNNEFGGWLTFETLTRTYLDTRPLLTELLDRQETDWINNFNRTVLETLSPFLAEHERVWLEAKCAPV